MTCIKCGKELPAGAAFCPACGKKQQKPKRKTKSRGNGLGSVYKLPNGKWCAEKTVGWAVDPLPDDAPPDARPHRTRLRVRKQFPTRKDPCSARAPPSP